MNSKEIKNGTPYTETIKGVNVVVKWNDESEKFEVSISGIVVTTLQMIFNVECYFNDLRYNNQQLTTPPRKLRC